MAKPKSENKCDPLFSPGSFFATLFNPALFSYLVFPPALFILRPFSIVTGQANQGFDLLRIFFPEIGSWVSDLDRLSYA